MRKISGVRPTPFRESKGKKDRKEETEKREEKSTRP